jgi:myo-inositol-1(or 4)-monophosphatase
MTIEERCLQICDIAKKTGSFIAKESLSFNRNKVEEKSFNQLVSYVDKTAEEMLVENLHLLMPEAGFITEEQTIKTEEKEWMWVIDPLDGTTNFIHGLPVYSVSIGLMHNGKTVAGVVYEINRDELFYAWENGPAMLNRKQISVKTNPHLKQSLLATGFPYYDFDLMEKYLNALHELLIGTQGMRRMGSAAVDLAYVACGRFDGFFEYGLSPWDVCGGAFIVKQAGGMVTDFNGTTDYIFGKQIIAASSTLHSSLQQTVSKHFHV